MSKKHMLAATFAIIGCFIFATFAADVVLGSREVLHAEDNVMMALDTEDGTDLTKESIKESEEINENEVDYAPNDVLLVKTLKEPIEKMNMADEELDLFSLPYKVAEEADSNEILYITADEAQDVPDITVSNQTEEYDKVISNVNESLNIRKEPSANGEIVGRLYKDSYGVILERGEEWTKISSGDVVGYAHNDYLLFDNEAREYIEENAALVVKVTTGSVNIRSLPSTDSEIISKASMNDTFTAYEYQDEDEWFAIEFNGETAYIYEELSELNLNLGTARTIEEIKKKEKDEALAKALASAKNVKVGATNRAAIQISDEEIFLMATVIASEALSESYEGKLAVANVIINRLKKGVWGKSITEVVYAPGQFSGSNTGRFDKFEKLVNEDCKKAAIEALAGVNNIDDFLYFISLPKANYKNYSKYYLLGGHCFYMR